MKRVLSIGLTLIVLLAASAALAMGPGSGGGPGGGGYGMGYGTGQNQGSGGAYGYGTGTLNPQYMAPEVAAKYLSFEVAVLPLRHKMLDLKIDLLYLQAQTTQDVNAINAKLNEIYSLRLQIMEQAVNYGLGFGMFGYGAEIGQ